MSLNTPALNLGIYAAFRRQAGKPGPANAEVEGDMAAVMTAAIQQYILSGRVNTKFHPPGGGLAVAPWPGIVVVFKLKAAVSLGWIV